jgi:hypothetical protein
MLNRPFSFLITTNNFCKYLTFYGAALRESAAIQAPGGHIQQN